MVQPTMKLKVLLLAVILATAGFFAAPARAEIFIGDGNGNTVKYVHQETAYQKFQKSFSPELFQQLDDTDREFALSEILSAFHNSEQESTALQKRNLQFLVERYLNTLHDEKKAPYGEKALERAMYLGQSKLARTLAEKYLSHDRNKRTEKICEAVSSTMLTMGGVDGAIEALDEASKKDIADRTRHDATVWVEGLFHTVHTVITSQDSGITDAPCELGPNDEDPKSLRNLADRLAAILKIQKNAPPPPAKPLVVATTAKNPCKLSEVRSVFSDAQNNIKKYGPRHKVYLGLNAMTCPIYGLVVQDKKGKFRFYPNSYREDTVEAVVFDSVENLMKRFIVVETGSAPATSNPPVKTTK